MKQTIGEIIKSMFVGPDNNPPTNVIDILKADHREVEGLFKEFENAISDEERKNLIDEIVKEISVHASVEEKLVYPELESEGEKTKEALEEHHAVKMLLAELADMTGSEETAPAKVKVISEMVKHHVQEEELGLLPKLKSKAEDLDELGALVLQEKELLLENYKPPSKAAEATPASDSVESSLSDEAPQDDVIINFAPDAELNSEDSELDEANSHEPISIETKESDPILPELTDTSTAEQAGSPKKHRSTSIRKKAGARKKASHSPAARGQGSKTRTATTAKSTRSEAKSNSADAERKPKTASKKSATKRKSTALKATGSKAKKKDTVRTAKSAGAKTRKTSGKAKASSSGKSASKSESKKPTTAKSAAKKTASAASKKSSRSTKVVGDKTSGKAKTKSASGKATSSRSRSKSANAAKRGLKKAS
ncbi:MAG: hemerythrin domain-containing protein [Candidatus Obscuribacterales bacterium]|nr:hemerythrin domain-containing protein [Candidatus Obscuribacterales bacterium]